MDLKGGVGSMIIRVVLGCYITWGTVITGDLVACRTKVGWADQGCQAQVEELKSVFSTITVGLMGWLSDKPGGP